MYSDLLASHHRYLHDLSLDHVENLEKVPITGQNHLIAVPCEMSGVDRITFEEKGLKAFVLLSINLQTLFHGRYETLAEHSLSLSRT